MARARILIKMNLKFSYLIKMRVGAESFSILVNNIKEVPKTLLEEISKQKITDYINEIYSDYKDYRAQTKQQFFTKMIKQSDFEIEDLNNLQVYDLNIKFENDKIQNKLDENQKTKIVQSSINTEFDERIS